MNLEHAAATVTSQNALSQMKIQVVCHSSSSSCIVLTDKLLKAENVTHSNPNLNLSNDQIPVYLQELLTSSLNSAPAAKSKARPFLEARRSQYSHWWNVCAGVCVRASLSMNAGASSGASQRSLYSGKLHIVRSEELGKPVILLKK